MSELLQPVTTEPAFNQVYAIMEESFPKTEHRPYARQKALLEKPVYQLYSTGSRIDAFAAVWEFKQFTYLEHFAVRPDRRNGGLGSAILKELRRLYPGQICLEVEPPDTPQAQHRIGFYRRNHYFLNDYDYEQPKLSEEYPAIPLMIMTSGRTITQQEFEQIRDTLYREVYGILT